MRIKIDRGTPLHGGESLCYTCRFSRVTRGRTLDEELVVCDAGQTAQTMVTFKVTSCTDYSDRRVPSYGELLQNAWILRPRTRNRPAGFVRATDLRDEEFVRLMTAPADRDRRTE
jgi:hypothetical protein